MSGTEFYSPTISTDITSANQNLACTYFMFQKTAMNHVNTALCVMRKSMFLDIYRVISSSYLNPEL
jgi:hypothetical protein